MRRDEEKWFSEAFLIAQQNLVPTENQKARMLEHVFDRACCAKETAALGTVTRMIIDYPWRFAFGVSALQLMLGTLAWGTQYSNMLLRFVIGG